MTLPDNTLLGRLSMVEVYVEYDGPVLFSAVNESGAYYIAVAVDDDKAATHWIYTPVSRKVLERVRAGEIDVSLPFRRPADGHLVRVVTPRRGGKDTAEIVRRENVPDRDLPRKGFPLALTTEPDRWRLDALREAAGSGERAHETRLIPSKQPARVLLPETVAGLLRKWERFWHALVPKETLRVASVAPGSLKVVFAAPEGKEAKLVGTYEDLVACGADAGRLRRVTKPTGVAAAYYDLVHFVAEQACDLELASESRKGNRSPILSVVRLPAQIAEAQGRALAQLQEERRDRKFLADVLAASKPDGTVDLAVEKGERLKAALASESRRFITGLKIGGHYSFVLTQTTRVEVPGAGARIELDLHAPPLPHNEEVPLALSARRSRTKPGHALEWHKPLSATDAQQAPSKSRRTYVPLGRWGQDMDVQKWFRNVFFGDYGWERTNDGVEHVTVEIEVIIDGGVKLGPQPFELTHDPTRARNKGEAATRLRWNHAMLEFLARNDSYVKGTITLRRSAEGGYELHLAQRAPGVPLRRGQPRGRTSA